MKKLLTFTLLAVAGSLVFTSCTVVEPAPATSTTTTHTERSTVTPAASVQTTTTRSGGY